ncbi:MAG: hypothetical protein ACTSYU_08925 [Promethearchaeota archaeon]
MRLSTTDPWKKQIQKKLVIVLEYAPPETYPSNFQSGLSFYQEIDAEMDFSSKISKHALKKFVSQDLLRSENGEYEFAPWETTYSSLFDCMQALTSHYSYTEIFSHISWQEYEILITQALSDVDFQAFRTFRFKSPNHRYEIDCVAQKNHNVFFIDAKRWKNSTISRTGLLQAIKHQHERVSTLITMPEQLVSCGSVFIPDSRSSMLELYIIVLVASDMAENIIIPEGIALPFARFNHFLSNFHEFTELLSPIMYRFPESTLNDMN